MLENNATLSYFPQTLKGLAEGRPKLFLFRDNPFNGQRIISLCKELAWTGFAVKSRRGWYTIRHPETGQVDWTYQDGFDLRVNGRAAIGSNLAGNEMFFCMARNPHSLSPEVMQMIDAWLGSYTRGSLLSADQRAMLNW